MQTGPLEKRIVHAFDALSGQLRIAARYVLDRPRDVALLSMREQARQAEVQPATMTRLAKHLGLPATTTSANSTPTRCAPTQPSSRAG